MATNNGAKAGFHTVLIALLLAWAPSAWSGAATHFSVSAPASTNEGFPLTFTVTALDVSNAVDTGYAGTVHFTSSDGAATLPANSTLTNGTGSFGATLITGGNQTITATDTVTTSITGTSGTIVVAAATQYTVSAPAGVNEGVAFTFTVQALDQFGSPDVNYTGTVHFSSTDGAATLPADTVIAGGAGSFGAILKTGGSQTIFAAEVLNPSIHGTSNSIIVAAATQYAVSAPAGVNEGVAFTFTVQALDQFGLPDTHYTGTVHFSTTDLAGTLPADTVITGGAGSFGAILKTGGSQTIFAVDVLNASIHGTSNPIVVAAATQYVVSAPAGATAGSAFTFTVQALDQFGLPDTHYTGTAHFSSSDGAATLPADTLITGGAGSFGATLKTAGNQQIFAAEVLNPSIHGTSNNIAVTPAAATHFVVSAPASATGNVAFNFTVTALDPFNNTATGYAGTVHFTSTDGTAILPANSTLTNGVGTFSATLNSGGTQTLTATDTVTSSITGTSGTVTVTPGVATHFTVSAPASATAGTAFNFTVSALDATNAVVAGYTGTVHFTSSDGAAVLPANSTLTGGVGTFSATLRTAGNQTITATDTVTSSITGTSNNINVSAAAATHFTVSAPASAAGNVAFNFTVTAQDQFNNTATSYAGTVHFTSSDGLAVLPANSTLTNGVGTFSATLKTGGAQTLTATDTVTSSITGTSGSITVTAALATHFTVSAPASATAGSAFNFTVSALDATNAVVTSYTGTVHFTSSDGAAVLPANSTLTNGVGTFSSTLKTAGNQTITATDTVTSSVTGASNNINVSAAAATHFTVSAPASATGNVAFNFTMTAQDQFNNTATSYSGIVHFTSTDGLAVLPANSTLTNGVGTFSATLKTAGARTLTATDTVAASITGTSGTITVTAAIVTTFSGSSPTGTGTITASFSGGGAGCTFVNPQFIPVTGAPASPPAGSAPTGLTFPHGLFDFSTTGCTPGSALSFTITYPSALPTGTQYWKYGPRTGIPASWYQLPAIIAGNVATFTITDGGLGDDDLAANGGIVDQGGPGIPGAPGTPTSVPTLSEWAMFLLAFAIVGIAMLSRRRTIPARLN